MLILHGKYEYAGFYYCIFEDENANIIAAPYEKQHSAAYKAKHCRAAAESFNTEFKWSEREPNSLSNYEDM